MSIQSDAGPGLSRNPAFIAALLGCMGVSTLHLFATGVLASDIIEELGMSRAELGFAGAANTAVGALSAPRLGRLTDRIGPKRSIVVLSVLGAAGLAVMAASVSVWILVVSSLMSGVPQGWANSATNKLIAMHLAAGERGVITGLKQSGVQFASFLAGLTLPIAATAASWRLAVGLYAGVSLVVAAIAHFGLPADRTPIAPIQARGQADPGSSAPSARDRLDPFVYRVAVYALLLGLAGGSVFRFLPLFAEEEIGFSTELAGLVVSLNGLLGIVARIWWGRRTEAGLGPRIGLLIMALGSAIGSALLLAAPSASGLLWLFAVVAGFTASAWNVVAMLAVIRSVPLALQGKATGIVLFGFLGGLSIAGPITGWSVDATGDYSAAWITTIVLSLLGAAVMIGKSNDPVAEH